MQLLLMILVGFMCLLADGLLKVAFSLLDQMFAGNPSMQPAASDELYST
jgi:hypothetical protein